MLSPSYSISPKDLWHLIGTADAPQLIDVRRRDIYESTPGMLPASIWQEPTEFGRWSPALDRTRPIVIACKAGKELSQFITAELRGAISGAAQLSGDKLAEFFARLAGNDDRPGTVERRTPAAEFRRLLPNRGGQHARCRFINIAPPHIDELRRIRRADQVPEIFRRDRVAWRQHRSPPWTKETVLGLASLSSVGRPSLAPPENLTQRIIAGKPSAKEHRHNQRQSGNQQQDENDLAKCRIVEFSVERDAGPQTQKQHRQAHEEKFQDIDVE